MKSLLYYMSKIKQNYPQIENLSINDYEKISQQINEDLRNNKENSEGLNLLAKKSYPFLCYLTKYYEKYHLAKYDFDDFISYFYIRILELHKNRYDSGNWYSNYSSYVSTTYNEMKKRLNQILKHKDEPIENLHNHIDEYSIEVYQKLMSDIDINDLANLLNNSLLKELTPLKRQILIDYYGLEAPAMTQEQIGKKFYLSRTRIYQHIKKSIEVLKDSSLNQIVYEYCE